MEQAEAPIARPRSSRRPSVLTATAMVTATETCVRPRAPSGRRQSIQRSTDRPQSPSSGRSRKLGTRSSISWHRRLIWFFGDGGHTQRLDPRRSAPTTEVSAPSQPRVDRAGRDALHIGLLEPSRRRAAAPGSPGNSCPSRSCGCVAPRSRRGSPRACRDRRYVAPNCPARCSP